MISIMRELKFRAMYPDAWLWVQDILAKIKQAADNGGKNVAIAMSTCQITGNVITSEYAKVILLKEVGLIDNYQYSKIIKEMEESRVLSKDGKSISKAITIEINW